MVHTLCSLLSGFLFFFFKQKTAYDMRSSDWSSDVCSSDLVASLTICAATWYLFEKTKLGALLRAGTENPKLLQAFGVNIPLMITLTYEIGRASCRERVCQ